MRLERYFKKKRHGGAEDGRGEVFGPEEEPRPEAPRGILRRCNACRAAIFTEDVKQNAYICPKCGNYFRMHARARLRLIADEDSFEEWDQGLPTPNPLDFPGYPGKVAALKEKTGLDEAILTGEARIGGIPVALGVCDGRFLMASMGQAVGEKITRAVERATEKRLPVILFAASGGARMQEGLTSLMQMAKTSAALKEHSAAGLLYISVLTDPTTGGVTASWAMLGDVILAEPGALVGFAGPRVIEQTIGQKLPKGFQRTEFLLEHGFADGVVERKQMREELVRLLRLHGADAKQCEAQTAGEAGQKEREKEQPGLRRTPVPGGTRTAWERVELARRKERPVASDYLGALFTEFVELHGDRCCGDDAAVIGGLAFFEGRPVTVIAQAKGASTKENARRNFGMPSPEGYRKALRLMKQAEKFGRPVICFVDTPGAFCGMEAEEHGQGEAIARCLWESSDLGVPILSVIIGEGGSGGALALAVADEVWMLENAVYSILSPEGFAAILWKDGGRAKEAAAVMRMTAPDLLEQGFIEQVIPEPEEYTRENLEEVTEPLRERMREFLERRRALSGEELRRRRKERFRRM